MEVFFCTHHPGLAWFTVFDTAFVISLCKYNIIIFQTTGKFAAQIQDIKYKLEGQNRCGDLTPFLEFTDYCTSSTPGN